ncbi:MAG: hypothetical protein DRP57_12455 [Spirochaetes bacterium]|nr:MAG: hypothetical protein DRP57_12455 [Spirochaetota bacterium]
MKAEPGGSGAAPGNPAPGGTGGPPGNPAPGGTGGAPGGIGAGCPPGNGPADTGLPVLAAVCGDADCETAFWFWLNDCTPAVVDVP